MASVDAIFMKSWSGAHWLDVWHGPAAYWAGPWLPPDPSYSFPCSLGFESVCKAKDRECGYGAHNSVEAGGPTGVLLEDGADEEQQDPGRTVTSTQRRAVHCAMFSFGVTGTQFSGTSVISKI